jgi:Multisubunit Na+/H+ antiporter, MnhC subunit
MEMLLSILIGLLFAAALYQMLSGHFLRVLIGLILISNAANLAVFISGGLHSNQPALIPETTQVLTGEVANALPQALVLTAIVIGFGLFAFALFLGIRAYRDLGTLNADKQDPLAKESAQ